jgi:hypothetical protein
MNADESFAAKSDEVESRSQQLLLDVRLPDPSRISILPSPCPTIT